MLEPGSFDICKNTLTLIIVILGYLELNTEVSNIGIETVKSNDCRGVSRDDKNTNSILAMIWEGTKFFYKDRWNFIDLFI